VGSSTSVASTKVKCDCDSGRLGARPTMFTDRAPACAFPNDALAIGIERAFDVPVQGSHDADARV
jgi:hypothetical protein